MDHLQALDPDQANRAGAVRAVVRSLEVDGHERPIGWGKRERHELTARGHDRSDTQGMRPGTFWYATGGEHRLVARSLTGITTPSGDQAGIPHRLRRRRAA